MFFLTFLFLVQTNSWFKTRTVHRCATDPVLARGPSNISDVAFSQEQKEQIRTRFAKILDSIKQPWKPSRPFGGGRNPTSRRRSMAPSHQCRVVLPELFSSTVMCAAGTTVFGVDLNARRGTFAYITESFKHSKSRRSLKSALRATEACFHPG